MKSLGYHKRAKIGRKNLPLEAECSINYVLINSDKEFDEIEMSKEFEEDIAMQEISENSAKLPLENFPKFRPKLVIEVLKKLDREGLDTLAIVAIEYSRKLKE